MKVWQLHLNSAAVEFGHPVVTVGNFDGVHRGHRKIIDQTVAQARASGEHAVVLTFEPHPVKVLNPAADFRRLKTLDQRLAELEQLGVDGVALVHFDADLRRTSPSEFARQILARVLAASAVLVGPEFRFGHRRIGDFSLLERLGQKLGFVTHAVTPVIGGGRPISSTRIREAVARGAVGEARYLLGRPFRVGGIIVRGHGRGRGIGFATANLETVNELLPGIGVYATRAQLAGHSYRGASFIGAATTFGDSRVAVETHLLDAGSQDLYGQSMSLEFFRKLRGQTRFSSPEALTRQIRKDVARVRRIIPTEG